MKIKLVRMFFAEGVRYRAGIHTNFPDHLFDQLPDSALVFDGKDYKPVRDLKKAPKVKVPENEVLNKEPDVKKHVPADAGDRLDPKHPQEPKTDSEEAFVDQPATRPVGGGDGISKTETKTSTKKL